MAVATKKKKKIVALEPVPKCTPLWSLDVSSSCIGWALTLDGKPIEFGLIKSPASWGSIRRIDANTERLKFIMELYSPDDPGQKSWVTAEWQSHCSSGGFHAQGLAALGQSQGEVSRMLKGIPWVARVDKVSERVWTKQGGRNIKKITRHQQARTLFPDYDAMLTNDPNADNGMDISDSLMLAHWRYSIR